jgi:ribonuclease HIII
MALNEQEFILHDIQRLQKKLANLEQILQLTNWRNIRIMFEADNKHKQEFIITDQFTFPFNLENELKTLVNDSIDHYKRDLETLLFKLKTCKDEK